MVCAELVRINKRRNTITAKSKRQRFTLKW
jgi:hypothetical protein